MISEVLHNLGRALASKYHLKFCDGLNSFSIMSDGFSKGFDMRTDIEGTWIWPFVAKSGGACINYLGLLPIDIKDPSFLKQFEELISRIHTPDFKEWLMLHYSLS